ncbi:Stealth CR1 domain-containing protein [Enterococcus faecium]|uniref:Stealth CR1 domain-containing protein n=1 Tax=Enterococcus faecium TaxID=1352 RepID=UPI000F4FA437|nr:Stealth CR1 domain-containing protein [Enterococcus faecium]EKO5893683.1 Stealth CR1 domain-containing protein [Enterococcus faecium]ROX75943.1 capsule biosynthesis protein CapK [Enterococcus faecium]
MSKIDFVVTWVDSTDPKWLKEKNKYFKEKFMEDVLNDESKFRDWDFFKYWFRSLEINTPWVNKVHLVTCGHIPEWLNNSHPKLNIVSHNDILPKSSLPTFNSQAIELCLHKIEDLSENFVYFNDDMFVNAFCEEKDFFENSLPKDYGIFNVISPSYGGIEHAIVNNLEIINKYFEKKSVLKRNVNKFFNFSYGKDNLRNIFLLPWNKFTGFYEPHSAISLKKSSFEKVWDKENAYLTKTVHSKFRSKEDLNFWVVRYWQICTGKFSPQKIGISKMYYLSDNSSSLVKDIKDSKHKLICLNDSSDVKNFSKVKDEVSSAFEKKYPAKSSFEI